MIESDEDLYSKRAFEGLGKRDGQFSSSEETISEYSKRAFEGLGKRSGHVKRAFEGLGKRSLRYKLIKRAFEGLGK